MCSTLCFYKFFSPAQMFSFFRQRVCRPREKYAPNINRVSNHLVSINRVRKTAFCLIKFVVPNKFLRSLAFIFFTMFFFTLSSLFFRFKSYCVYKYYVLLLKWFCSLHFTNYSLFHVSNTK